MCEPRLLNHTDKNFEGVIFRPATVCGYAPRQFDLSKSNKFCYQQRLYRVFGGDQLRPNLHVWIILMQSNF